MMRGDEPCIELVKVSFHGELGDRPRPQGSGARIERAGNISVRDETPQKYIQLFPGKLKSRWYGPFAVIKDMKNGAIELCDEEGNEFIVNKQRAKPYQKDMPGFDADDFVILDDEGGVTLYLMRRSFGVLRSFIWTILGGRFNQIIICRKAHLLEDKQILSVGVFDEMSFYTFFKEALKGSTRDLDSIWEETRQDCNFTRSGFKNVRIGDIVRNPGDVVSTYKRWCQDLCDGVKT
ncbi:hypothetical protein Tco_1371282 [Tanacetum coccineum]